MLRFQNSVKRAPSISPSLWSGQTSLDQNLQFVTCSSSGYEGTSLSVLHRLRVGEGKAGLARALRKKGNLCTVWVSKFRVQGKVQASELNSACLMFSQI